ncbi:ABC transporter permease [soil metagenome]
MPTSDPQPTRGPDPQPARESDPHASRGPNPQPARARSFGFSRLDLKVALRMLARYPGLTVVGTVALAVAIALGVLYFEGLNKMMNPRLDVAGGERVVAIRSWDVETQRPETRSLYDLSIWREQARTVEELGAAVMFVRNLDPGDGPVEPVRGAEVTASAFRLMGTPPLLGRVLTTQDEQPGEPPVVLLDYTLWQTRFAGDPAVVGRAVKLGSVMATVVGVMPEGFGFPVRERIWVPLRVSGATLAPRTGPSVVMFGRLAGGATMEQAQVELGAIAARIAADYPDTHRHLRPRVVAYGRPPMEGGEAQLIRTILYAVNSFFLLLLAVISANIATLVFARTATRSWEMTVRNVLGATRRRIVAQLFVEALVLTTVAAVLGLLIARIALGAGLGMMAGGDLPFWVDASLSLRTVLYAGLLALFAAAIVGILPALRATRVNLQDALRSQGTAHSGLQFGGFWTAVIVVQVAITVAFLPLAAGGVFESNRFRHRAEGIGAERYLTASVAVDREDHGLDSAAFEARARASLDDLEQRLRAEPGVEAVTFADRLPVMDQFKYGIEVDSVAGARTGELRTSTLVQVSRGFFHAFGTEVIVGRDFSPIDYEGGRVLVVNESFVRHVFGGGNALGQRVRIGSGEDGNVAGDAWYEVVGVVRDFGWQLPLPHEQSAMYRPRLPAAGTRFSLAVRVQDPESFAPRLRALAVHVDPTIRLTDVQPLTTVGGGEARINWALTSVAWLVSFVVLLLSATGIHALMAFTVSRRTREIGIRVALGARPRSIVAGIFGRALVQVSAGILAGSALVAVIGMGSVRQVLLLLAANGVMLVVGMIACAVPLRRALAIQPTQALKAEA